MFRPYFIKRPVQIDTQIKSLSQAHTIYHLLYYIICKEYLCKAKTDTSLSTIVFKPVFYCHATNWNSPWRLQDESCCDQQFVGVDGHLSSLAHCHSSHHLMRTHYSLVLHPHHCHCLHQVIDLKKKGEYKHKQGTKINDIKQKSPQSKFTKHLLYEFIWMLEQDLPHPST